MTAAQNSPSGLELSPGTNFAGRFIVERLLGVGGMGAVFAARHLELDQLVAVKVMLPEIAANAETAARFHREARASVRIKSDYVARVLDVSRLDDGTPYMVMEYLEGSNLEMLVHRDGPLDVESAARYVIQACDAIAAAHVIGIVHRDIKPQNLFLALEGDGTYRIKVLDFGISKVAEPLTRSDATLTKTKCALGSPSYMAPEQMQSAKDVDPRADIWGLGCSLFELVVGRPPFQGDTMPELCAAVLSQPAPIPSSLRLDLPPSLDDIILRCLEKSPSARYASVAELAEALLALAPFESEVVVRIARRHSTMPPPTRRGDGSVPPPSMLQRPRSVPPPANVSDGPGRPQNGVGIDVEVQAISELASPALSAAAIGQQTETAFGQRTGAPSNRSRIALGFAAVSLGLVALFVMWANTPAQTDALKQQTATASEPPRSMAQPELSAPAQAAPAPTSSAIAQSSAEIAVVPISSAAAPRTPSQPDQRRASQAPAQSTVIGHKESSPKPHPSARVPDPAPTQRTPSLNIELK